MYLDHYHNGIPVHVIEIHLHMSHEPILGLKIVHFFLPFSWTTASVLQTMKLLTHLSAHLIPWYPWLPGDYTLVL